MPRRDRSPRSVDPRFTHYLVRLDGATRRGRAARDLRRRRATCRRSGRPAGRGVAARAAGDHRGRIARRRRGRERADPPRRVRRQPRRDPPVPRASGSNGSARPAPTCSWCDRAPTRRPAAGDGSTPRSRARRPELDGPGDRASAGRRSIWTGPRRSSVPRSACRPDQFVDAASTRIARRSVPGRRRRARAGASRSSCSSRAPRAGWRRRWPGTTRARLAVWVAVADTAAASGRSAGTRTAVGEEQPGPFGAGAPPRRGPRPSRTACSSQPPGTIRHDRHRPDHAPAGRGRRDAPAIAALFTDEGYPAGPSDIVARLERFDSPESRVVVAEHEGAILGFIAVHAMARFEHDDWILRILALVVDAGARERGVGRALMAEAERIGRELGAAFVEMTAGSPPARGAPPVRVARLRRDGHGVPAQEALTRPDDRRRSGVSRSCGCATAGHACSTCRGSCRWRTGRPRRSSSATCPSARRATSSGSWSSTG